MEKYQIPIHGLPSELRTLRATGLYCVGVSDMADLRQLAGKLIARSAPGARGVVVTAVDAGITLDLDPAVLKDRDIRAFQLIGKPQRALAALSKDLDRALTPRERCIILVLPASYLPAQADALHILFKQWLDWLNSNGCTLLLLVETGPAAPPLVHELKTLNDLLSGLAFLEHDDQPLYQVCYWRSAQGVAGETLLTLSAGPDGWTLSPGTTAAEQPPPLANEHVYIQHAVLEGEHMKLPAGWKIFHTAQELFEHASQEGPSTAVFALEVYDQLAVIAGYIHTLRLERGPQLKLILKELGATLRYHDEQNLLSCGATMVVPRGTSLARTLSLVENVQATRSHYSLAQDPAQLFQARKPRETVGAIGPRAFIAHVLQQTDPARGDTHPGVLVCLDPVPGLSAQQVLGQLNLKRYEDRAAFLEGSLYLFLSGCHPNLVAITLTRVFRLPYQDIFSSDTVYPDIESIRGQCLRMRLELDEAGVPDDDIPDMQPVPSAEPSQPVASIPPRRYQPQPYTLAMLPS